MKKLAILTVLLISCVIFAETTPVMLSLVTPAQWPDKEHEVTGLRLSLIYGESRDFTGLDLGIINRTDGNFSGLAIGGGNIADDTIHGAQFGIVNWNRNGKLAWGQRSIGAQLGIVNYSDTFCGAQTGCVNISGSKFTGWQYGLFNSTDDLDGLQSGVWLIFGVNVAQGDVTGCQIGLVNYADTMKKGLQIGIVNIISNNGWMPVLPIINGNF